MFYRNARKSMHANAPVTAFLLFCCSTWASADEVPLAPQLGAKASIAKAGGEQWEKTLVIQFSAKRRVLSTNDGMVDVSAVVNHSAHPARWLGEGSDKKHGHGCGALVYLQKTRQQTAQRLGVGPAEIALVGTSADMDNLAIVTKTAEPFVVTALVTAGAKGNALRTGAEDAKYVEPDPAFPTTAHGQSPKPGTVNILLLTNAKLTDGGLARAIVTVTEAKTTAFQDLRVPSTRRKELQATGTGTDSVIVVSGTTGPTVTYPGGHSLIGSMIGKAVYEAVAQALEKQNGFTRPEGKQREARR
jgi:adenosylcobinamide amidohydrolase